MTTTSDTTTLPATLAPMQHTIAISHTTYVQALSNAFTTTRYAICMEFSVALSLFHESGRADGESKAQLQQMYAAALYDCATPDSSEYKSTRRKIQLASLLFQHIGNETVAQWVTGAVELSLLNAIAAHLQAMNIRSYDSILTIVGRPRAVAKPRQTIETEVPTAGEPVTKPEVADKAVLAEHIAKEQARIEEYLTAQYEGRAEGEFEILADDFMGPPKRMMRRASDVAEEGAIEVTTEHLRIYIPENTSKDELMRAALEMIALAQSLTNTSVVGDLPKEVVEEVLHPAAKATEPEEEPEDAEAIKRHQQQEIDRIEAEKKAAMIAAKPVAQAAPSRYRAKPISKK